VIYDLLQSDKKVPNTMMPMGSVETFLVGENISYCGVSSCGVQTKYVEK
jgi:hypothetical protein